MNNLGIVIASSNVHKIREFREMLKPLKIFDVHSLLNFPDYIPPEETGNSFEENAILKAVHAAKTLGMLALGDDTGLVVPALNGEPGLFSKRYAGADATDSDNRRKLLYALKGKSGLERSAYIECCLALADAQGIRKTVTARCEGIIAMEERGKEGDGYDPLFIKNDYDKTYAELGENVKNRISHRRKAFDKISLTLESL